MKFKINNLLSGQSLFEVVVALGVSTIVMVSLVSLTSVSLKNASFSKNKTEASRYAQEAVEWLRQQRDGDPDGFATNVQTPTWCINELSWVQIGACTSGQVIVDTIFTRQVSFSNSVVVVSGQNKNLTSVDVEVSWVDATGTHIVKNSTDFSDWRQR